MKICIVFFNFGYSSADDERREVSESSEFGIEDPTGTETNAECRGKAGYVHACGAGQ